VLINRSDLLIASTDGLSEAEDHEAAPSGLIRAAMRLP
jgi:hypothetical protein